MKNFKVFMLVILLGATQIIQASSATAVADGATTIVNKSDMAIIVAYNYRSKTGIGSIYWSSPIAAGATGTLAYKAGDVIGQVTVFYSINPAFTDAAKSVAATDGQIRFVINKIDGCPLYVYGYSKIIPGSIDATVAATPVAARYAAWWTGSIPAADLAAGTTAQTAINDAAVGSLVSMHIANIKGLNDITAASQIPAGVTVFPAF